MPGAEGSAASTRSKRAATPAGRDVPSAIPTSSGCPSSRRKWTVAVAFSPIVVGSAIVPGGYWATGIFTSNAIVREAFGCTGSLVVTAIDFVTRPW
jgi:hypothetical protein